MRFSDSNVVFRRLAKSEIEQEQIQKCTYKGISLKTLFFLGMTVLGAVLGILGAIASPEVLVPLLLVSGIGTLIFSIVAMYSPKRSKVFGTLYCLMEGALVGLLSILCEALVEGAVSIALLSTIAVFGVVALLYVSNIIKVNGKFLKFLSIFAISFIVCSLLLFVASLFGLQINLGLSIAISSITILLASLYLMFDLEHIRTVVENGYAKEYEWYASFGLAFTLIWLYVEILELVVKFAKFFDRN